MKNYGDISYQYRLISLHEACDELVERYANYNEPYDKAFVDMLDNEVGVIKQNENGINLTNIKSSSEISNELGLIQQENDHKVLVVLLHPLVGVVTSKITEVDSCIKNMKAAFTAIDLLDEGVKEAASGSLESIFNHVTNMKEVLDIAMTLKNVSAEEFLSEKFVSGDIGDTPPDSP